LSQAEIRALALPDTYNKYLAAELNFVMSTDESFFRCLNPKCASGQSQDGGEILTCHTCGFKSCESN